MFGLLDDEELFLKADDEARPTFTAAGCRQWSYPTKRGPQPGDYWRPPDEAHEDPEAMRPWAELGLAAALRKAAAKAQVKARPAKRAAPGKKPARR
jgi:DNA transformation protein